MQARRQSPGPSKAPNRFPRRRRPRCHPNSPLPMTPPRRPFRMLPPTIPSRASIQFASSPTERPFWPGAVLPNSEVTILFNDQPIGSAKTDPAGAWVMVPPEPLPVGDHQVTLRMQQPDAAPVTSEQSIALKVPERGADRALVVLSENNRPSRVLQQPRSAVAVAPVKPPEPAANSGAADPAAESAGHRSACHACRGRTACHVCRGRTACHVCRGRTACHVCRGRTARHARRGRSRCGRTARNSAAESTVAAVNPDGNANAIADTAASPPQPRADLPLNLATVDYNDRGDILFAGTADGGATVRLYVDNNHVGDARVEAGGNWQFAGKENIRPGTHNLRVDKLHADGSVAERVELPFVRADPTAVAALIQQPPAAVPEQSSPAPDEPAQRGVSSATGEAAVGADTAEKPGEITSSGQAQPQPKVPSAEPPAAASAAEDLVAAAPVQDPAAGAEAADTVAEPPAAAPAAEEIVAAAPSQDPATGAEAAETVAEPPAAAPAAEEAVAAAPTQDPAAGADAADTVAEPPAAAPAAEEVVAAAPTQDPATGAEAADTVVEPPAAAPAAEEVVAAAPTQDPATGAEAADTVVEPPAMAPAAEEVVAAAPTQDPATGADAASKVAEPPAVVPAAEEAVAAAPTQDPATGAEAADTVVKNTGHGFRSGRSCRRCSDARPCHRR